MINYCNKVLQELDDQIIDLEIELSSPIQLAETAVTLVLDCLKDVKEFILKRSFENAEEEIYFFKKLKPSILSKLIYYNSVYKIEMKKPYGGDRIIKTYLNQELTKLKRFFDNNLEFYKYYRTNSTYLDNLYFVRGKFDIKLSLDTYYFESDQNFSTTHDYKVAKIIAYDLIQVYLEDQLFNIKKYSPTKDKVIHKANLNWTASKSALIELIYALHSQAVFENGNTDIKSIAKAFELAFNVDLGDIYHTFLELRNRKTNRTKFIDALLDGLIKKMDEQE
ncbi:RteC domain-containing protein [Sphingobacterium siyangense subsp. cladoniae]|uniref:RteC domain-containing protein n=1 Tax=Sphingobacterium siyangense TaxID=459529 RepID=UPI0031F7CAC2